MKPHSRCPNGRVTPIAVSVLVVACAESPTPNAEPFDVILSTSSTLVSLQSELIGHPTDLALDAAGRLWIADAQLKRVIAVDPFGELVREFGREGVGPGEFQSPAAIVVRDSIVRVLDTRSSRVVDYSSEGRHLGDQFLEQPILGEGALSPTGRLILPTMGLDSSLAIVLTLGDTTLLRLGPVVAAPDQGFDFAGMRDEIAKGNVPAQFRNHVTPVAGASGILWLVVQSEAEVRKYSTSGELMWSRTLKVEEVEQARQEFFRRNAAEQNPSRVYPLRTVAAAREVAGNPWLLMQFSTGNNAIIYVLNSETGAILGRITALTPAPARRFAVDPRRRRIYLGIADEATILAIELEDGGPIARRALK